MRMVQFKKFFRVIDLFVDFLHYPPNPLLLSQQFLWTLGTELSVVGRDRIPNNCATVVVSNHRSIMDAAILMSALNTPIHFACHHYMGQIPLMSELINQLGFLPLDKPKQPHNNFFDRASHLLLKNKTIGIFPEGAHPMVKTTTPNSLDKFQRGFAHLALRTPVENLVILPVAIAARNELNTSLFPVRWLQLFDPLEPLFDRPDWHPLVLYGQVKVTIGTPISLSLAQKPDYHGRKALRWIRDLTEQCHQDIQQQLQESF
jgi:1-acyl-sn-glycerol-3-phosphate acyltransferase